MLLLQHTTYIFLILFSKILHFFPRKLIIIFGKIFGFFMYFLFPLRKKVAQKNINIAFPNKTKKEINSLVKQTYQHFGILMYEFIRSHNIANKEYFRVDDKTKKLLSTNEGIIFITGHIGNWEMIIPILSKYKKVTAIVREQRNLGGHKFFSECRKLKNVNLITNKGSKRQMLQALKNGDILILASDQNAKDRGTPIDFFNKEASIPKGAGHFYYSTQKKILVGFCILNKKNNYEFNVEEIVINKNYEQKDDIIVEINTIYVKLLENKIKEYPNQYFWFHKKWDKSIYN